MPGSNTPKLPASQIQSWPGCQRRTSSFHSIAQRLQALAQPRFASSTAAVVSRMPGREDHAARLARGRRQIVHLGDVAAGGFSSITCLPAASASRAIAWRTCGGVQIATASTSGIARKARRAS